MIFIDVSFKTVHDVQNPVEYKVKNLISLLISLSLRNDFSV